MSAEAFEPWVTTAEVAAFLGKPPSFVYDNADRLGLPRYKIGATYRYRLSQVEAWVQAHGATASAATAPAPSSPALALLEGE